MKTFLIITMLSLISLPIISLCQTYRQLESVQNQEKVLLGDWQKKRTENNFNDKSNSISIEMLDKKLDQSLRQKLRYSRSGGGDSGGGGSVILSNHQYYLKDFLNCKNLRTQRTELNLSGDIISDSLFKIDPKSILPIIKNSANLNNNLVHKMIWAAIARANWYSVDTDLQLDTDPDLKLAIFKRPIGIMINANLFSKLDHQNQMGLIFHEALRMLSLGFNIPLSTIEIEKITCHAFSNQNAELSQYPNLNNSLLSLIGEGSVEVKKTRLQMWENTFESISQLNDVQYMPAGLVKTFFYQLESSKFEALREAAPDLTAQQLEEAFYSWAALEAPTQCTTTSTCDYFEEWPMQPYQNSKLSRWTMFVNNFDITGWRNRESGFDFIVSKSEVPSERAQDYCENIHLNSKDRYTLLKSSELISIQKNLNLEFIINRNHLTTMENEGLPLLLEDGSSFWLWTPRSDLEKGFAVLNSNWTSNGRVLCIKQ
jgi:hypothetical protein